MTTRVCAFDRCDKEFTVGSRPTRRFCSRRCQQADRRGPVLGPVPTAEVRPLAEMLVRREGSLSAAARVYADRHGITHSAAWRQLERVLNGQRSVSYQTYDRLWVLT